MGSAGFLLVSAADAQCPISIALSLTVEMSISGNCVTTAQQLHWKPGDENNPANSCRGQLLLDDANLRAV